MNNHNWLEFYSQVTQHLFTARSFLIHPSTLDHAPPIPPPPPPPAHSYPHSHPLSCHLRVPLLSTQQDAEDWTFVNVPPSTAKPDAGVRIFPSCTSPTSAPHPHLTLTFLLTLSSASASPTSAPSRSPVTLTRHPHPHPPSRPRARPRARLCSHPHCPLPSHIPSLEPSN